MVRILLLICCVWQLADVGFSASYSLYCKNKRTVTNPRIIIIGAGTAAIACATKLLEYGFENFQLLEAEPRIGGRVNTVEFGDYEIDLGAQWCHGEKDNVVFDLAKNHDLLLTSGIDDYHMIRSDREVLSDSMDRLLKDILNYRTKAQLEYLRGYNGSLRDYMTEYYFEKLKEPEYAGIDETIAKEALEFFIHIQLSSDSADDLGDVSGRGIGEFLECEGDQALNWKDRGYKEFLKILLKSKQLGNELGLLQGHVTLSKTVTQINWNADESKVEIRCRDGEVLVADHVIVTVSLGVLKAKHEELFRPKLPMRNIRAIDGLAFGAVVKIFVTFPKPFWYVGWYGASFLWREEDLVEIRGTSLDWLEDTFGFYADPPRPNLLEGWLVGHHSRRVERLPPEEVYKGVMFILRKFLSWRIPEPDFIKISKWHTNENFLGTWSFRSMHTYEVGVTNTDLAQPLNDICNRPIVQFAGEATHEYKYGTVHGATETGWREAKVLADLYGRTLH